MVFLAGLNALLRREPWASTQLSGYAGKTVLLKLADKNILLLAINADGSLAKSDPAIVPDVTLAMPFTDIAALINIWRSQGADAIARQMHIQGEAGLAQLLASLAKNLRWDAEADLAKVVGDIAAVRLCGFARQAAAGVQDNGKRLQASMQSYLAEESGIAVKQAELTIFRQDLAIARQRLQLLEQRINRLVEAKC